VNIWLRQFSENGEGGVSTFLFATTMELHE
jgi:hypothetical protein